MEAIKKREAKGMTEKYMHATRILKENMAATIESERENKM